MSDPREVRVRFAPSPTGNLHLGTTRTALFNWLFARSRGGKFLLRIEDTDQVRSRPEFTDNILASLSWLGLTWDEEPVYQSQRFSRYREVAGQLLAKGLVYPCFCTRGEIEARKRDARKRDAQNPDQFYGYDRRCASIAQNEARQRMDSGELHVLRYRFPSGTTVFEDVVLGTREKDNSELDDFVILKSDGQPLYNFACVVDDHDMGITHVIRGNDHVDNSYKQIHLNHAMGWEPPVFAHLPMILGPDKEKLSKRHGALSALEYYHEGFIKEAMINYLVLLGWSLDGETTYFTEQELIACFTLERIRRSPSVFDIENLKSMNTRHIFQLSPKERTRRIIPFLVRAGVITDADDVDFDWLTGVVEICGDRLKVLPDFIKYTAFFFRDEPDYNEKAVKKNLKAAAKPVLEYLNEQFTALETWAAEPLHEIIIAASKTFEMKLGKVAQPVRVAVTGGTISPPIDVTLEMIGKEQTLARLKQAMTLCPE